ncbi:hypothetical protein COT42_02650 [Candidatus Saganbacteria bacterium CG08_land_8_20_14_0_20_45_16]|uniref:Uncharacterized protein n=1 Tax=Candidatus Saganbacteria bacterium CG08_land_8_20_14_0_20_45_16 TaxID=2014293 RepID=A0A2H0XZR4_UNCSA|nr:MAG: hypothetical protein COT42_02650 [Candidatus Saganbacteria bacterium CG08_land_8_20_14_0_20_45_16]
MSVATKDKFWAATAYLFGVPALYLVLTRPVGVGFVGYHAKQAFYLWLYYALIGLGLKLFVHWIWLYWFVPGLETLSNLIFLAMFCYAAFCAGRVLMGRTF